MTRVKLLKLKKLIQIVELTVYNTVRPEQQIVVHSEVKILLEYGDERNDGEGLFFKV